MRHASLFSGIGGFDLAALQVGMTNVFTCEIDEFCNKVLDYHFPNSVKYKDVKTLDGTKYKGTVDIISGGFPCQPFSTAGKREGTNDSRFLWNEMFRIIKEVEPRWVVAENVRGIISIEQGMVFEQVCADLESIGYEVQTFIIPACSINAPHRRDRVWFIANSNSRGRTKRTKCQWDNDREWEVCKNKQDDRDKVWCEFGNGCNDRTTTDTESQRYEPLNKYGTTEFQTQRAEEVYGRSGNWNDQPKGWSNFPTQSPLCGGDDGLPRELVNISFPKWRRESIKALGNAIVPGIAKIIFQSILEAENATGT